MCAGGLCLDHFCVASDTPCDDHSVCTVGDQWINGVCTPGTSGLPCPANNECQTWFCNSIQGCRANADNADLTCNATLVSQKTMVCAAGNDTQNGCKCGLWQHALPGPEAGTDASTVEHTELLLGVAQAGKGAIGVGSSAPVGGVKSGWITRLNASGQSLNTTLVPAPNGEPLGKNYQLARVTPVPAGWLAAGSGGEPTAGWLVRISGDSKDADGRTVNAILWQKRALPVASSSGEFRDIAALADGTAMAVGSTKSTQGVTATWLVRVALSGDILGQSALDVPSSQAPELFAVVAATDGWIVAGHANSATGSAIFAKLSINGATVWQKAINPAAGSGAAFGLATNGSQFCGFGSQSGSGTSAGWLLVFDGDGKASAEAGKDFAGMNAMHFNSGAWVGDGWIAAGNATTSNGVTEAFAAKYSLAGKNIWGEGQTAASDLTAIAKTSDATIIAGSHLQGAWAARFVNRVSECVRPIDAPESQCVLIP